MVRLRRLILLCAAGLAVAMPAEAQEDVAAFYRGKQLRLIVEIGRAHV